MTSEPPRSEPSEPNAQPTTWHTVSPSFLWRPTWWPALQRSRWPLGLLLLWLMGLAGTVLLAVATAPIRDQYFTSVLESQITDELTESGPWALLVVVALVAPFAEELIFRSPLRAIPRFEMDSMVLGFAALWFGVVTLSPSGIPFALGAVLFGLLWVQQRRHDPLDHARRELEWNGRWQLDRQRLLEPAPDEPRFGHGQPDTAAPVALRVVDWWQANPHWPIYVSILAFGAIHAGNYSPSGSALSWVWLPLLVSPQLWLGVMFSIARIRYGFWASVALHAAHNGVSFALLLATTDY